MYSARSQPQSARPMASAPPTSRTAALLPPSGRADPEPTARSMHDDYGLESEANDPLQLEHVLGYSGGYRRTVHTVPIDDETFIKSLGSLISIENVNEPQSQRFLRGHDMSVSCLAVSPSGNFIASGQEGTMNFKGLAAPIFIWDSRSGRRICALRGLSVRCNVLAFSPDEQFVCACDEDCLLYVWDLATGEVVFGQRQAAPVSVVIFADANKAGHNVAYELVLGIQATLHKALFTYDNMRMQWSMKLSAYQVPPSGGLVRQMLAVALSEDRLFVFVGTASGEMMVYRRDTAVFRACIPVCTNGLQDLVVLADGCVICGGGDGHVVKLRGRDMAWQKIREAKMDSTIRALSLSTSQMEVLVSCGNGAIFRMMTSELDSSVVTHSNHSAVSAISCSQTHAAYLATGSVGGEVRVWDLADYDCVSIWRPGKSGAVLCVQMLDNHQVLSGWQDGSVKCSTLNAELAWFIPSAHRDGTLTLHAYTGSASLQYLVTGGGDGAIRVWKLSNRELITQYTEHRKAVAKVLVDSQSPNVVHSVGSDCSVLSFDLKANKRIVCHIMTSGVMTGMSQRVHREYELVTCDSLGRLLYWDIDYRDPVLVVQDPARSAMRVCAVSPSGRFIAFAGEDQVVKVLDETSHRVVALGRSHCAEVLCLAWTVDERQVISGGADTCLSVWNFYLGGGGGHK